MDPYLGDIKMFAGNFAPVNWAFCDGSLLPISQNEALYTLLGTIYGGDGISTFGLPDLRGRTPLHFGTGQGLPTVVQGQFGGTEEVTLTVSQMPAHTHTLAAQTATATQASPQSNVFANSNTGDNEYTPLVGGAPTNVSMAVPSILATGGNQPYSICQPSLCISFIIALQGIFPSQS